VLETLLALILGILGAALNVPALKEITWSNEMKNQFVTYAPMSFLWSLSVPFSKIDDMDSRLGFANYVNRRTHVF